MAGKVCMITNKYIASSMFAELLMIKGFKFNYMNVTEKNLVLQGQRTIDGRTEIIDQRIPLAFVFETVNDEKNQKRIEQAKIERRKNNYGI